MGNESRTCLITGGSGFQGYHLTRALLARGFKVRCLDRVKPLQLPGERYEFIEGDFSATNLLAEAIRGCDIVYHLAYTTLPQTSNDDPDFDVSSNILGTIRMMDEAVRAQAERFIFISSGGTVYGVPQSVPIPESHPTNPTCSYGITKLTIEKYLRLYRQVHGLNTVSIRLANPFGENQRVDSIQGVVAAFCYKALKGIPVSIWGDGTVRRDFIYIADVIEGLVAAIDAPASGCEINIGSGRSASINELLDTIDSLVGRKVERSYTGGRKFDVPVSELDITLASRLLNWQPRTSLRDGLARTLAWQEHWIAQGH